jgi:putative alpha-1,2-mannosidase
MWKNIVGMSNVSYSRCQFLIEFVETNIMVSSTGQSVQRLTLSFIQVGTHADSLIAEAVVKGVTGFDLELAYEAVYKDATVPPVNDGNTSYVNLGVSDERN